MILIGACDLELVIRDKSIKMKKRTIYFIALFMVSCIACSKSTCDCTLDHDGYFGHCQCGSESCTCPIILKVQGFDIKAKIWISEPFYFGDTIRIEFFGTEMAKADSVIVRRHEADAMTQTVFDSMKTYILTSPMPFPSAGTYDIGLKLTDAQWEYQKWFISSLSVQ